MKEFFENPWTGYSSVFVCFLVLIFSISTSRKLKLQMGLNKEQGKLFDKLGAEPRRQILLALGIPVLLSVVVASMAGYSISVTLATGYASSASLGGFTALSNIWKAYSSYKTALHETMDDARRRRLMDVYDTILRAFDGALLSLLVGVFLLFAYNVGPFISPSWWVLGFVLTITTTRVLAFTTNAVTVAEKYESDRLHGCIRKGNR